MCWPQFTSQFTMHCLHILRQVSMMTLIPTSQSPTSEALCCFKHDKCADNVHLKLCRTRQCAAYLWNACSVSLFPAVDLCSHSNAHMLIGVGVSAAQHTTLCTMHGQRITNRTSKRAYTIERCRGRHAQQRQVTVGGMTTSVPASLV